MQGNRDAQLIMVSELLLMKKSLLMCSARVTILVDTYSVYLTIIPRGRVGYEMIDSQRGA